MGSRDQRRIQGPEKTMPYSVYQESQKLNFTTDENFRIDNRSPVDVQKLFMAVDVISQAKGSSFIEIGNTKLMCAVYGPRELQRGIDFKLTGQVSCEVKFAPFSSKIRKSPQPDRNQKELSRQLKEALETVIIVEKFPKAQIDVCITVIENGGSLLSTCLTAAGLALCQASIDVYDLVVGADLVWKEGVSYVNPTLHEEECLAIQRLNGEVGDGSLTLGMMPKFAKSQVVLMVQEGELMVDTLIEGISLAMDTCQRLYNLARQTLMKHVEKVINDDHGVSSSTKHVEKVVTDDHGVSSSTSKNSSKT